MIYDDIGSIEDSILGACLLDGDSYATIAQCDEAGIKAADFSSPHRGRLYTEIRALALDLGSPRPVSDPGAVTAGPNLMLLCQWLNDRGTAEAVGGFSYVCTVSDRAAGVASAPAYIRALRRASTAREAARVARGLVGALDNPAGRSTDEITIEYSRALADLRADGSPSHLRTGADLASAVLFRANNPDAAREDTIPTGIPGLDTLLGNMAEGRPGGLVTTRLYLVAGRPGHGKSAVGLNIARACARAGVRVHFQSLEMSANKAPPHGVDHELPGDLAIKLATIESGIGAGELAKGAGRMDPHAYEAVHRACLNMGEWPLTTDDSAPLHYDQIFGRIRRLKARHDDLKVVVIDYIGLVKGSKNQNTRERIAAVSNGLKLLAKELQIAIVALSQLNRDCEDRADKRPRVADLRDCGDLEQDADAIIFVQRPGLYPEWENQPGMWLGKLKDRHNPQGQITLDFTGYNQRIGGEVADPIRASREASNTAGRGRKNTNWRR